MTSGSTRLAIIGIGADLREDDAIGSLLASDLIDKYALLAGDPSSDNETHVEGELFRKNPVLVLNGTVVPEQHILTLTAFGPDTVIVVDAARIGGGAIPGDLAFIDLDKLDTATFSTHTISVRSFVEMSQLMGCNADFIIIGIQPASLGYGEALSEEVSATKVFLESLLGRLIDTLLEQT